MNSNIKFEEEKFSRYPTDLSSVNDITLRKTYTSVLNQLDDINKNILSDLGYKENLELEIAIIQYGNLLSKMHNYRNKVKAAILSRQQCEE